MIGASQDLSSSTENSLLSLIMVKLRSGEKDSSLPSLIQLRQQTKGLKALKTPALVLGHTSLVHDCRSYLGFRICYGNNMCHS